MIESLPFVAISLFFLREKKFMGEDEMEMFSLKWSSKHTEYNLITFLMYTFKYRRGVRLDAPSRQGSMENSLACQCGG
jgi:hypothetical protein